MPEILRSLRNLPERFRRCAVAIGNFDGVHSGHRELVATLVRLAADVGGPAMVFTFDPPPVAIIRPELELLPPLSDIPRRAELLGALGVDAVLAYPTDAALVGLTAADFFQQILVDQLRIAAIVEGPNFRFGNNRVGDTELLSHWCAQRGIRCCIVEACGDPSGMISSTRIKQLIQAGEIAQANKFLVTPYQIQGIVDHGDGRGRKLGTPTANLTQIPVLLPCHGVYAGRVEIGNIGVPAAVHIGPNPTFGEDKTKVEVHLIDWTGELYSEELRCSLLERLRDVRKFASAEELRAQINKDIESCRTVFNSQQNRPLESV